MIEKGICLSIKEVIGNVKSSGWVLQQNKKINVIIYCYTKSPNSLYLLLKIFKLYVE